MTAEANPRLVRLGTPFSVVLKITSDGKIGIKQPSFPVPDGLTQSQVASGIQIGSINGNTSFAYTFTAQYNSDKAGNYTIGPFEVAYTDSNSKDEKISADAVTVEVYEDAPRPASDILNRARSNIWGILIPILLLAVLAGLIAGLRYLKRKPTGESQVLNIFKSPEQLAVEEIKALNFPDATDETAVKEYYDKIDEILKKYLTVRYEVKTADLTTWEIKSEFIVRKRTDSRIRGVFELLNDCDWVKFAKTRPTDSEIRLIPSRASDILLGIKSQESPEIRA
ncbi:MAG: BatD family protein [bacterium]